MHMREGPVDLCRRRSSRHRHRHPTAGIQASRSTRSSPSLASSPRGNKVIARIQFSDVTKLGQLVGKANLPQRHGGVERAATGEWVAQRLAAFPRMGLPDDV